MLIMCPLFQRTHMKSYTAHSTYTYSTTVSVPSSELGPPPTSLPQAIHSPAGEGVGGPNSDDWRKSMALCLLCDIQSMYLSKFAKEI